MQREDVPYIQTIVVNVRIFVGARAIAGVSTTIVGACNAIVLACSAILLAFNASLHDPPELP